MKNGTQLHNNTRSHTVRPVTCSLASALVWLVVQSQIAKIGGICKKKRGFSSPLDKSYNVLLGVSDMHCVPYILQRGLSFVCVTQGKRISSLLDYSHKTVL
jgi:hypothetical protein